MANLRTALSFSRFAAQRISTRLDPNRRRRPIAGYIGWLGQGNLGDEAIFEAVQRLLPGIRILQYGHTFRESVLDRLALGGKTCFDMILLGGGTLINPNYLEIARLAVNTGLPCISMGTGVGSPGVSSLEAPIASDWREVLNAFKLIGVRGPLSKQALQSLGVASDVTGDLALSAAPPVQNHPQSNHNKRRVVINAMRAHDREEERLFAQYRLQLREVISHLRSRGFECLGLAMAPDDVEPTTESLPSGRRSQVRLAKSTRSALELLASADLVLSMRLHGAVLACLAGSVPLLVAYRDKCLDFAASMNLENMLLSLGQPAAAILRAVTDTLRDAPSLRGGITEKVDEWQTRQRAFGAAALLRMRGSS